MKKLILFLPIIMIMSLIPTTTHADNFGPDNWDQYRLNGDKNAVFDNGSDPLEYKEFETENEVRATPVIVGNRLYVGNHESGELLAFNIITEERLWENEAPNWVHSEMIHHDGKIYVGFGNRYFQDDGIRGTGENGLLSLDADTGEILWKYNTDGEVMPTPVYYEGAVYITTGDRHLYKVDADSGDLLNKEEIGSTVSMSSPNITDDILYVGGGTPKPYTFSAYDLKDDKFKWQTEFPDAFAGLDDVPPAISDNLVVTTALVNSGKDDPEHMMYVMDIDDGELEWETSLGKGEFVDNNKSGAPIIYEGNIYVGSPITETFYAYDLETGEKQWEYQDEVMKAPPVAQDGIVYFSNTRGFVYALNAETGEYLDRKKLGGKLAPSGPIIMNDTLFVGSQDANVYAVPLTEFESKVGMGSTGFNKEMISYTAVIAGVVVALFITLWIIMRNRFHKSQPS